MIPRAILAASMLAAAGCSSALTPEDPTNVGSWMELYGVPGVSIAVINDFELDYVEVHGVKSKFTLEPVTDGTLFQAASLSKSVSATGVMSLVQEGVVSLDANIVDYLSSWQLPDNALQDSEHVTLRRLLSHTAGTTVGGFRGYRYTEPVPTLIQILNGEPPANSDPIVVDLVPGGHHIYPEIAAAGLWTTPTDVARFLIELQLSLRGASDVVLSQENAELLLTEVERDYSLGFDLWTRHGQDYFGHSGANDGFRGRMVAHRTDGYGVVILTNSDRGDELSNAVLRLIGEREDWPGY